MAAPISAAGNEREFIITTNVTTVKDRLARLGIDLPKVKS
jgi:hypothetical protein